MHSIWPLFFFFCFNLTGTQKASKQDSVCALPAAYTVLAGTWRGVVQCPALLSHCLYACWNFTSFHHLVPFLPYWQECGQEDCQQNKCSQGGKKKKTKLAWKHQNTWVFHTLCLYLEDSSVMSGISCTIWQKHLVKALEIVVWWKYMWVKMSHGE